MDQLNLTADTDIQQPHPTIALHQLENALANLTAAIFWSSEHSYFSPEFSSFDFLFFAAARLKLDNYVAMAYPFPVSTTINSSTTATQPILTSRLNVCTIGFLEPSYLS